jgi:hypothetical protein
MGGSNASGSWFSSLPDWAACTTGFGSMAAQVGPIGRVGWPPRFTSPRFRDRIET